MSFAVVSASQSTRKAKVNRLGHDEVKVFWLKWMAILVILAICFSVTLSVAPFLHLDEFLIVELGRVVKDPNTDWSLAWLSDKGQPVFLLSYLGPIIQETAFEIIGQYGPRIISLLGAFLAATFMVGWLIARNLDKQIAILLGLVFLLDPLFVQSYTMGRLDGLAIAMCLLPCWLLRLSNAKGYTNRGYKLYTFIAGGSIVAAFLIWPTAVFLLPLVLLELFLLIRGRNLDYRSDWRKALMPALIFGAGCLSTGILLIAPIASKVFLQLSIILDGIKVNTRSGTAIQAQPGIEYYYDQAAELLRVLKFSPVLLILSLISFVRVKNIGLILATISTALLMILTLVYTHRVIYLLPYLIVASAQVYQTSFHIKNDRWGKLLKNGSMVALVFWCISISLFVRTYLAINNKSERDRSIIYNAATSIIGKGDHSVLLFKYEFYYSGRSLGWKMYLPYHAYNEPISTEMTNQVLPHVDYVIMDFSEHSSSESIRALEDRGFRHKQVYYTYENEDANSEAKVWLIERLRSLFSIYRYPYGPYAIYQREKSES